MMFMEILNIFQDEEGYVTLLQIGKLFMLSNKQL